LWQVAQPLSMKSFSPAFCVSSSAASSPVSQRSKAESGVISVA